MRMILAAIGMMTTIMVSSCSDMRQERLFGLERMSFGGDSSACHTDVMVSELIQCLSVENNPASIDQTASVSKLVDIGLPAVPKLLDAYVYGDEITRMRVQQTLAGILMRQYGFVCGSGWKNYDADHPRFLAMYDKLGRLNWGDSLDNRRASARIWLEWWQAQLLHENAA